MFGRRRHYDHVLRVLGLFGMGFALFLFARYFLIPADFGVYGFYRAGALDDVKAQAPVYAGETLCLDCHSDIGELRQEGLHANVRCESCHGPLAQHASGDFDAKPDALNPRRLCLQCHATQIGLPVSHPNVVAVDHAGDMVCTDCHLPHRPGFN